MALTRSTDPLVWIDCEMTGLDPSRDTILSISCILTTADLNPLDTEGFNTVIYHTSERLSQMSEWCIKTHGESGLTQECLSSPTTAETAATQLLSYIKHYIPEPSRALLAGNSIHADRGFLLVPPWNGILEHLHYRLFDVSAMKEMVRRWAGEQVLMAAPRKELRHTAREDVLESIQEAQYYKGLIESITLGVAGKPQAQGFSTAVEGFISPIMNVVSLPVFAPANTSVNTNGNRTISLSENSMSILTQKAIPRPVLRANQGQEAFDMLRNNGTRVGDVEELDQGFRTDVP